MQMIRMSLSDNLYNDFYFMFIVTFILIYYTAKEELENSMKKNVIHGFIYNMISSILPVLIFQFIILPLVAKEMTAETYGLALTMISAIALIPAGLGNVLNNVYLLEFKTYSKFKNKGDFGILVLLAIGISITGMTGLILFYDLVDLSELILLLSVTVLTLLKEYYIVLFWSELKYKNLLLCNLWLIAGYLVGFMFFIILKKWEYIYLLSQLFSLLYIMKCYNIFTNFCIKTDNFKSIFHKFKVLTITSTLSRSLQYIDRLLLYPLLGGSEVTIYYISTLVGKVISLGMSPINSFLLSQLAQKEEFSLKLFLKILSIISFLGILGYFVCLILTVPILNLLYSQWAEEALKYVYITTMTSVIYAISSIVSPFILKFCNINWQTIISGASFIIYSVLSLFLLKRYGLVGFCFGGLFANLFTLLTMICIFIISYKNKIRRTV